MADERIVQTEDMQASAAPIMEPFPQAPVTDIDQSLADMDGARVQERAAGDFAHTFWSTYKTGHYRGALIGVAIVAPLAVTMGIITAAAFSWPIWTTAAVFGGFGGLMAAEGFGATGAAAASRASGLAEKHARILDADAQGKNIIDATDDKLMYGGRGQHYEFSANPGKRKLYNWKSGLAGGLMGAACGGILGLGGVMMEIMPGLMGVAGNVAGASTLASILGTFGLTVAPAVAGAAILGALVCAGFGLTFGIDKGIIKSFFNQTDANIKGDLTFKRGLDLGREQSLESDEELTQHRLHRQEAIAHLEHEYNERIFWGALSGRFRGFAGCVPGMAIGAAVGALVAGALALMLTGGLATISLGAPGVIWLFSCAGAMLGMNAFTQAGTEAGAEASARAIDNEFERNRALRAQGITPPVPQEPEGVWTMLKPAIYVTLIGAAVGVAIAPLLGPAIFAVVGAHAVAGFSLQSVLASALVSGLVGTTYGIGGKYLKTVTKPFTSLYDKLVIRHNDSEPEIAPQVQTPAYAMQSEITPEEAAQLDERLNAGSGKNFSQMAQQLQPATLGIGA